MPTLTRTPVEVPAALAASVDYSLTYVLDRLGLRDTAPALWTEKERAEVVQALLRTALHRNVADRPIHAVTVREHLDAVAAAKQHGQRYLNWWAGAQGAMDRVHEKVIAVLGRIPDQELARELADDVGVILADAREPEGSEG